MLGWEVVGTLLQGLLPALLLMLCISILKAKGWYTEARTLLLHSTGVAKRVPFSCVQPGANFYGRVMKPSEVIFLMENFRSDHTYSYAIGFHKKKKKSFKIWATWNWNAQAYVTNFDSINKRKIAVLMIRRMHSINKIINIICFLEIQRGKTELISWIYLYSTPCSLCWQTLIAE